MSNTYNERVAKLLKLGRPEGRDWQDYLALGITREDIPELLRLVQDNEPRFLEPPNDFPEDEDLPEWYGQIHTWRALAQLKAEEAIPAMLEILRQIDDEDDDWLSSDVRLIFGMIGPVAIEPLKKYLADENNPMYARSTTGSSLAEIGNRHPEERERCIQGIAAALEEYETNDEGLNSFLIGDLIDLKAVEQIDLIKKAFEADAVDKFVNGDFEDVQVRLGLIEERITPRPRFNPSLLGDERGNVYTSDNLPGIKKVVKKDKNKRKQEKKSRKKNRKKK